MKFAPLLAAGLILLSAGIARAATAVPNIVIVLVDDAGLGDWGVHGHPFLQTPAIDRLHHESIRLTDFHVAPMCTPTRGQLLTGLDAVRNGATSVTGGRSFLRVGLSTLPEMLARAGYRTGIFGKWHLGDNYPHRPIDRGFQDSVWVKGWGFTSAPEFSNSLFDGRCYRGDQETRFKGYITDFCFDEAMAWMKQRQARAEPFFCYVPLHAAHSPHQVPEKYSAPYREKAGGAAGFFGMLASVDENIGRLESFLRSSGLRENTILIFMTDNGGTAGVKFFNAGLRGRKTEFYEGGHRVPAFIRWPAGKLRAAADIGVPLQIQDIAPTLLEFAGATRHAPATFDGVSLFGLLRGEIDRLPERMFVVQYSRAKLEKWECAVVWNEWRLVHGKELYQITTDRAQATDLAQIHPGIVGRLRTHYERWWAGLGAKAGKFVATTIGSKNQPVVELTSADWQDIYCDNANHIRQALGGPRGGPWNILVDRAGEYEFSLRRWPPDLDLPLSAPQGANSVTLPIAGGTVVVAGSRQSARVSTDAREIIIRMTLPKGPAQLQAWFQDAAGEDLRGAYFATVRPAK
jgi:arylsulfatase A-like enzyme